MAASKKTKPKKYTVRDYYEEEVIIGGLPTTRGQFIKEMLAAGHLMKHIDFYLFTLDQRHDREMARESARWASTIKEAAPL